MDPLQNQSSAGAGKKSFGPLIGIVVIIIVLVVGALYFWGGALSKNDAGVPAVSSSDDVSAIQSDLSAGSDLKADFSDIEADLK